MFWYQWLALISLIICTTNCFYHFFYLIRSGRPKDYAAPAGTTGAAIRYSFTGAMSPAKKESAYLHLPTYTAGIFYHIGTFLSIFLFFLFLLNYYPQGILMWIPAGILVISGSSGLIILIKRMLNKQLRSLSNPDDFISNILVTIVHFMSMLALFLPVIHPAYFVTISLLLLYLPLGKLKHTIYFFAARYHLGHFYGWRGVWPPKKINN